MAQLERKTLVIVRHAHRHKTLGSGADNGISEKGQKQARALSKFFGKVFDKKTKPVIYSSPKLRCIQTVEPLARKRGVEIKILESLNESSTTAELQKRITAFDALWRQSQDELTVICSHGDWIPAYLKMALGFEIDLEKGAWAQIEMENRQLKLEWLAQDLTSFG